MPTDSLRPAPLQEGAASRESEPRSAAVGPAPTYSEAEVAHLLRRAAELERGKAAARPGLSLAEVEAIARESGLDPELVRVAARTMGHSQAILGLATRLAGAPLQYTVEHDIEGEIGTEQHEALVADLRAGAGPVGFQPPQISTIGRTLTLSARTGRGMLEVTLSPRAGKTHLRIDASASQLAGGLFGGLMGGMTVCLGPGAVALAVHSHQPAAVAVLAGLGVLGGAFALARTIFSFSARGFYRRTEDLADKLEARVREELSRAGPLGPG